MTAKGTSLCMCVCVSACIFKSQSGVIIYFYVPRTACISAFEQQPNYTGGGLATEMFERDDVVVTGMDRGETRAPNQGDTVSSVPFRSAS